MAEDVSDSAMQECVERVREEEVLEGKRQMVERPHQSLKVLCFFFRGEEGIFSSSLEIL